jgi:polyferredoxin
LSLAKIRIAISSLIFILFLLLFSGWEKLSIFLSSYLPPLQIVPAIIHIITKPEVLFIAGLAFLTVLSFIFGRVYCSFLCPLGTLQDIFIVISRRIGLRRKHSFQQPANGLRYSIFILTLFTAIAGIMVLINLLDPFSFFGRTVTHLFQPLTVWIFNASADILKHFGVYAFVKKLHYIPLSVLASTFGFILLLLIMSFRQGRLYCNTICPVGALLGMISRVSFFQLAINRTDCNACGQCESVCKAGCIDMAKAQIDQDRCVSCFNCLDACPQSVISYRPFSGGAGPRDWSPARRGFLIGSAAAAGSMFWLTNSDLYSLIGADRKKNTLPVTPPGSAGLQHFTAACSACHLCVSACPTKVITPAFLEYGIAGMNDPAASCRVSKPNRKA